MNFLNYCGNKLRTQPRHVINGPTDGYQGTHVHKTDFIYTTRMNYVLRLILFRE